MSNAQKEPLFRNHCELHGVVSGDIVTQDGNTMFTLRTQEIQRHKEFTADHVICSLTDPKVTHDDFCMVVGYINHCGQIMTDGKNIANLGRLETQDLIFKNHTSLHGYVTRIMPLSQSIGYTLTLLTEASSSSDKKSTLETLHTCVANKFTAPIVANTRQGDWVLIEGHLSDRRHIIISKFNNITQARQQMLLSDQMKRRA